MKYSYVYILSDIYNQKLYIGVTSNLLKRINEHRNHLIPGYTSKYNVTKLVYYEDFLDIKTAIKREKNLKGKLRQKKIKLIEAMNPNRLDLYNLLLEQKDMSTFINNRNQYLNYVKKRIFRIN